MLVGNKLDLVISNEKMRKVKKEEVVNLAQTQDLLFEEISA